ncbi:MAG: MGMT family protein [Candidatus Hydrothermae bacterium]|mgnify:CR=1 FL=1|nr:MGMT family protein [Candidatus Hydrothermae bacterium]
MARRKSWREKLEKEGEPRIVDDPKGRGRMLIPTPLMVDELVRKIPPGKLVTVSQLRDKLARDFGADFTCPLVTGIFLKIVAETAEEDLGRGKKDISPYWRVVKDDGSLNPKFPGEGKIQAQYLRKEGHEVLLIRNKYRVMDYKSRLVNPSEL